TCQAILSNAVEMPLIERRPGWGELKAVQRERVFLADGNQYFNRPGPRIVESLEILAEIFHGGAISFGHATGESPGFRRWPITSLSSSVTMPAAAGSTVPSHAQRGGFPMALESIRMSALIPGSADEIYTAWLDGARHGQFTGGAASVEAHVGGRHT